MAHVVDIKLDGVSFTVIVVLVSDTDTTKVCGTQPRRGHGHQILGSTTRPNDDQRKRKNAQFRRPRA